MGKREMQAYNKLMGWDDLNDDRLFASADSGKSLFDDGDNIASLVGTMPKEGAAIDRFPGASKYTPIHYTPPPRSTFFEMEQLELNLWAGRGPREPEHVDKMVANGITHYLDLRQNFEFDAKYKDDAPAADAIYESGIIHERRPVRDMGAPSDSEMQGLVDYINSVLEDPFNILYVTCKAGKERTGVLVGWLAKRDGLTYDESLRRLREKRPVFKPLPSQEYACRRFLGERVGTRETFAKVNVSMRLVSGMPLVGRYEAYRHRNGEQEVFAEGDIHRVRSAMERERNSLANDYEHGGRLQTHYVPPAVPKVTGKKKGKEKGPE